MDTVPRHVGRLPECGSAASKYRRLPPGLCGMMPCARPTAWRMPVDRLPAGEGEGGGGGSGPVPPAGQPGPGCGPRHGAPAACFPPSPTAPAYPSCGPRHGAPAACHGGRGGTPACLLPGRRILLRCGPAYRMAVFRDVDCGAGRGAGTTLAHRSPHTSPSPAGRASPHARNEPIFPPIRGPPPSARAPVAPASACCLYRRLGAGPC